MTQKTVILLHGLGRTRYSMSVLARQLRREGYTVHNFGYPSIRLPIAELSKRLEAYILKHIPPQEELHFITHSLGSIVVRQFALTRTISHHIAAIVMLGPPNQGAALARFAARVPVVRTFLGPALHELGRLALSRPDPSIMIGVIAGGTGNSRGLSPFLQGDNDGIVRVQETELAGASHHLLKGGLHSFLMYYPSARAQAIHFLKHGRFF